MLNINYRTTNPVQRDKLIAEELQLNTLPPLLTILTYNSTFPEKPSTWTENGVSCSATYNADGTVNTLTKNGVTRTYSYSGGKLSGVV